MTVNHPITVDLVQPGLTPRLYAMQHDANSRVIVFTLTQAGQPWEAPAGAIFGLSYRKTDGTRGYYTENITCTASQICVSVAPQVLTCPGMVDAALVCNAADGSRIAAFPLQIQVRPDPAAGKTDSDDYFNPSDALRYTPQDLTEAQKQQARANLGLTEAAPEAAAEYLYNGYPLPPLPDWDKTAYPYAIITEAYLERGHVLWVCSEVIVAHENWMDTGNTMLRLNGVTTQYRSWKMEDTEGWEEYLSGDLTDEENVSKGSLTNEPVLWVNFDLHNQNNGLYLAASEPVALHRDDAVRCTEQTLTDEQQAQARANIGAAAAPREINLGDYGIDIAAYVTAGNGRRTVSGTQKMWEEINWGGDFVFLIPFGSAVLKAFPIGCAISNGVIFSVSLDVQAVYNDVFIVGGVSIAGSSNHADDTVICNVSTITPLA